MSRRIFCILLTLTLLLPVGCGQKPQGYSWQDQYDLGVRLLSEGNYQDAVIAFAAAIEIDPRRPEGYAGLADARLAAGDREGAIAALEEGVAATGDPDLEKRLEELYGAGDAQGNSAPADGTLFAGPYLAPEDVELLGMSLEDASALALADGVYDADNSTLVLDGDLWRFSSLSVSSGETESYGVLDLYQSKDSPTVDQVQFHGWREGGAEIAVPVHALGICLGDSWQQVLSAMGFSQEETDIIGGPQDISVTRETENGQPLWQVGFSGEGSSDGMGQILCFYRDSSAEGGESQIVMEFHAGVLNNFLVFASAAP